MHTYNQFKNSELMVAGVGEMVRTIEKIAASRLHQMNDEVSRLDAYAQELSRVLNYLSHAGAATVHPLTSAGGGESVLVIVGGNKGLVGGQNHDLVSVYMGHAHEYQQVIAVGRTVAQLLEEEHIRPGTHFDGFDEGIAAPAVSAISDYLFDAFGKESWKRVDILYANYLTISRQEAVIEQFLPFTFPPAEETQKDPLAPLESALPVYEPSPSRVYNRFLDLYIRVRFYKLLLTAKLSELSARTIEMEHAATKADGMLAKIRHDYAKERRANSTLKQLSSFQVSRMI